MDFTILLDVLIGLTLIYLGASLFVTIVNEYIAQVGKLRAKQLGADLKKLIDDPKCVEALITHPALAPFFTANRTGGSYVNPRILAEQLIGGLRRTESGVATMEGIISAINSIPGESNLKKQLQGLAQSGEQSVEKLVDRVAIWTDQSLTMLGETYKKRTQTISFVVGLIIAGVFNIDTLAIANHLYRDKAAREAISLVATDFVQKTSKETLETCAKLKPDEMREKPACSAVVGLLEGVRQRSQTLGELPIGWPVTHVSPLPPVISVPVGWLLTALAISLGASFWFDLLSKVINVRHGMRRPKVDQEDGESS